MLDHEDIIVKWLYHKNRSLQDEEWRKASLFDKAFSFLILLGVVLIITFPIYLIFQLIRIYLK